MSSGGRALRNHWPLLLLLLGTGVLFAQTLSMADGRGFHLTNFLLALVLVGLVYLICHLLIPTRRAAGAAAPLFAAHPLIVEPIAWISGRKDLPAVFTLGALAFWLRRREQR